MRHQHIMEEMLYQLVNQVHGNVLAVEIHLMVETLGDVHQKQQYHIIWIQEIG